MCRRLSARALPVCRSPDTRERALLCRPSHTPRTSQLTPNCARRSEFRLQQPRNRGYGMSGKPATRLEHGASTSDVLAAAMGVYSYPFFASSELSEFVASVAAEKFAQPKLYVLAADRDELRPEHLLARVPVFYGRPVRSMYDDEALKGLTGCTTAEAMASSSGPVYAIGGRTPVLGRPGHHLHALHGWGLNFEGNTTRDYLRYVKDGRLIAADVKHEVRRRVWLWASAAFDFADANHRARWCLPAIGFGAFLSALPSRSVNEPVLRRAFVDALSHAALSLRPRLTIELRDRGGTFLSEAEALRSSGVVYSHGDEGDLFRDPGKAVDAAGNILVESERLVLMNAWDDRSFIGNGGARDPTIDGFFVAGSGPNRALRNASYLFNPFISRSLLEPGNWRVVDEPQQFGGE